MDSVQSVVAAVITPASATRSTEADHRPLLPSELVLLSERKPGKHLAGYWEFPGGRIEPGESPEHALSRELKEELGIEVMTSTPWCTLTHHYPEKSIRLIIHRVSQWSGVPSGVEGQAIAWLPWSDVPDKKMPPADRSLLKVFGMAPFAWMAPRQLVTQNDEVRLRAWSKGLEQIAATGWGRASWWLSWPVGDRINSTETSLAKEALAMAKGQGHAVLINGSVGLATEMGADGVYLSPEALAGLTERPKALRWVVGACHTPGDLAQAKHIDADCVTVSPLRQTPSHPKHLGLGGGAFEQLMAHASLPVLALGGVGINDLAWVRSLGGFGVAGIDHFWRHGDCDVHAI